MDRDELLALDKEVLVDLVLRLHERVAALEAGVGRPPKGPGASSIPPWVGYKPNRAERRRKKRGPKKGHLGQSRRRAAPDVGAVVRLEEALPPDHPVPLFVDLVRSVDLGHFAIPPEPKARSVTPHLGGSALW